MPPRAVFEGQKYGNLLVLENKGRVGKGLRWLCRCELCGSEKIYSTSTLRSYCQEDCGCVWKNSKDISGTKIGKITVIEKTRTDRKKSFYLCRCNCGREFESSRDLLVNGRNNCGCKRVNEEIIGKRYGFLTVLSHAGYNDSLVAIYLCRCKCGKERNFPRTYFMNNTKRNKTCGCKQEITKQEKPNFQGHGEIGLGHFNRIRDSAIQRKIEFNITIEYIWELFLNQGGKCAISGVDIVFSKNFKKRGTTASLDRIDSNKGYIPGNVQWVHKKVNMSKQKMSDEEFIEMCKKIADYQRSKEVA